MEGAALQFLRSDCSGVNLTLGYCGGMTNNLGFDHTGTWTPSQYAADNGWSFDQVAATAKHGVAEEDAEDLTATQRVILLEWCRSRVEENLGAATTVYSIHRSSDGLELIHRIELDASEIENLSSDTPEGHFQADRVGELTHLGGLSVYAILH